MITIRSEFETITFNGVADACAEVVVNALKSFNYDVECECDCEREAIEEVETIAIEELDANNARIDTYKAAQYAAFDEFVINGMDVNFYEAEQGRYDACDLLQNFEAFEVKHSNARIDLSGQIATLKEICSLKAAVL